MPLKAAPSGSQAPNHSFRRRSNRAFRPSVACRDAPADDDGRSLGVVRAPVREHAWGQERDCDSPECAARRGSSSRVHHPSARCSRISGIIVDKISRLRGVRSRHIPLRPGRHRDRAEEQRSSCFHIPAFFAWVVPTPNRILSNSLIAYYAINVPNASGRQDTELVKWDRSLRGKSAWGWAKANESPRPMNLRAGKAECGTRKLSLWRDNSDSSVSGAANVKRRALPEAGTQTCSSGKGPSAARFHRAT